MNNKTQQTKHALINALRKTLGNITKACEMVGINRSTYYDYMKDPVFKRDFEECEEIALDFAESQMYKKIQEGDGTIIKFFLKTKGKKRGYVERTESEQTITHSGHIDSTPDLSKLSDEEYAQIKALVQKAKGNESD